MTRAKMSTVMNEGFDIFCKEVTSQVFTVVCLLVDLGRYLTRSKVSKFASPSIRLSSVTITSNVPVISSFPFRSLFFSSILQSHL